MNLLSTSLSLRQSSGLKTNFVLPQQCCNHWGKPNSSSIVSQTQLFRFRLKLEVVRSLKSLRLVIAVPPLDDQIREQIVARVMAARAQRPLRLAQMRERFLSGG